MRAAIATNSDTAGKGEFRKHSWENGVCTHLLQVSRLLGGTFRVGSKGLAEVFIALLCSLNTPGDNDDL